MTYQNAYITRRHHTATRGRLSKCQGYSLILGVLTLTLTLPFLWVIDMGEEADERDVTMERLGRFVRSLNSVQSHREQHEIQRHTAANSTVQLQFPWLQQNNTLPNYFLHGGGTRWVKDAATVFLHQHRSAGGAITKCLEDVSQQRHLVSGPRMTSDERKKWDGENTIKNTKYDLHRGQYAFGLCGKYTAKNCFQFTMFREPMARAVSSYEYCKSALADEMCKVVNANAVSLKQWILHQGSLVFQQLTFNPEWCGLDLHVQPKDDGLEFLLKPTEFPCWYKHKLKLERLTLVEREHLLDYILEHMDQWFTVIGLVEEFNDSIKMLEHVLDVPLGNCSDTRVDTGGIFTNDIDDNRANRKRRRQSYYDDADDDNDPDYLIYDYEVQKALDADFKIYKKAMKTFQIQRQVMFNDLKRVVR